MLSGVRRTRQSSGNETRTDRHHRRQPRYRCGHRHRDRKRGYPVTGLNKAFLARDSVKSFLAKRIPVGKPGTPEQVARLVGGILDENLTFLTGETIYIDGGQGMFH